MRKIDDCLKNNINGLCFGNRLLLPFEAEILKVNVEDDIVMDFSSKKREAEYNIKEGYTEIYFHEFKSLDEVISKYEKIKMIVVEKGDDIFDFKNHRKLSVSVLEHHKTKIEELDEDTIFIE